MFSKKKWLILSKNQFFFQKATCRNIPDSFDTRPQFFGKKNKILKSMHAFAFPSLFYTKDSYQKFVMSPSILRKFQEEVNDKFLKGQTPKLNQTPPLPHLSATSAITPLALGETKDMENIKNFTLMLIRSYRGGRPWLITPCSIKIIIEVDGKACQSNLKRDRL